MENLDRSAWDRIAAGYDRTNTPSQMWLGSESLRRAGLRPGMRFLDVAAGSGALSVPAARLGARVVATDLSPAMLDRLERRAGDEALSVETHVMDGHALAFDDDSFDIAGSQFGVMLFPDMPKGIRELARVVKPGGRVLMTVYGDPHEIEFLGFFVAAVQAVMPTFQGPPMDPLPLPFQLHDRERLRHELTSAGLKARRRRDHHRADRVHLGQHLGDRLVHSNPIVGEILTAPRPQRRRDRAGSAGPGRLGPRTRRRPRPGDPDGSDQHRDRDQVMRMRVLVVGAGIAGLATTRTLARSGFSPEVIEREPASLDAGTGIYLPGNAARALRALGLGAGVAEQAVEIPRQRFLTAGRADCSSMSTSASSGPASDRVLRSHRAELHDALREGSR